MNWADWTIIAIIAISGLFSLKRGFVKEALSLASWVAAFIVARLFTAPLSLVLQNYIEMPSARVAVAFAILFLATLIVGALISALIVALVQATGLSSTDRILGIGFGLARGALLIVVLVALLGITPAIQDPWWHDSRLIPHFIQMESWTRDLAQDVVRAIWNVGL
ncbi:CvpA family protein [Marinobacterium sedimentorum]|uniref:CvpA family protein n=1 Tax=Marinobacterium sedimentorum TaxID=2927804 RepID=UPI0020C6996E|nr:CvpA family protein [Marinobacterium sedimentorum]MCP8689235.1 CvpA family protein [Marinobacterium sedimentorum]